MRKLAPIALALVTVAAAWGVLREWRWGKRISVAEWFLAVQQHEATEKRIREHRAFRDVLDDMIEHLRHGRCQLLQATQRLHDYCVDRYPYYLELLERQRPGRSLLEKVARGFIDHFRMEIQDGNLQNLPPDFLPSLEGDFDEGFRLEDRPLRMA